MFLENYSLALLRIIVFAGEPLAVRVLTFSVSWYEIERLSAVT